MRIKSTTVYDGLTTLIDTINLEPDPAIRLASFMYLSEKYRELVIPERDKAAYDARVKYAAADVARISGSDKQDVYYWTKRHCERTGAERINRREIADVSDAIDLTKRLGIHRA
jgi:hypothetical protein